MWLYSFFWLLFNSLLNFTKTLNKNFKNEKNVFLSWPGLWREYMLRCLSIFPWYHKVKKVRGFICTFNSLRVWYCHHLLIRIGPKIFARNRNNKCVLITLTFSFLSSFQHKSNIKFLLVSITLFIMVNFVPWPHLIQGHIIHYVIYLIEKIGRGLKW